MNYGYLVLFSGVFILKLVCFFFVFGKLKEYNQKVIDILSKRDENQDKIYYICVYVDRIVFFCLQ